MDDVISLEVLELEELDSWIMVWQGRSIDRGGNRVEQKRCNVRSGLELAALGRAGVAFAHAGSERGEGAVQHGAGGGEGSGDGLAEHGGQFVDGWIEWSEDGGEVVVTGERERERLAASMVAAVQGQAMPLTKGHVTGMD